MTNTRPIDSTPRTDPRRADVRATIVIPCYNEERRLDVAAFESYLASTPSVGFLFVNDGSTDQTASVLRRLAHWGERARIIDMPRNSGKAEAVRTGMRAAFSAGVEYAGYFDADLATPLSAIGELVEVLDSSPHIDIAFGARVALLGRRIERKAERHYSGRMFATAASLVLNLPIYDTQCGAKLFRGTPGVTGLFDQEFGSRWIFDVEIFARYLTGPGSADGLYEHPLKKWTDIGESKVKTRDFLRAVGEMAAIFQRYRMPRAGQNVLRILSAPFLRYVSAGGVGTALHYLTLALMVEGLGLSPGLATAFGAMVGALVNYVLNYHLTFASKAPHSQTLPRFMTVAALSAVLNAVGMTFLVNRLQLHYMLGQLLCTLFVLVCGYVLNRTWTFTAEAEEGPGLVQAFKTRPVLATWAIARLPAIAILAFALRGPLLNAIEKRFDIVQVTLFAIDLLSTPESRLLLWMAGAITVAAPLGLRRRFGEGAAWFAAGVGAAAFGGLMHVCGAPRSRTAVVLLLLLANLLQDWVIRPKLRGARALHLGFSAIPGSELLLLGRYLRWLRGLAEPQGPAAVRASAFGPSVFLVAGALAVLLPSRPLLVPLERALRAPADLRIVGEGNMNGAVLSADQRYLFVTGQGIDRMRRYDLEQLTTPPLEAEASTGAAQGVEYDASERLLYLYSADERAVVVVDEALRRVRTISVPNLSDGDPWIAVDPLSETITIASEADNPGGKPIVVLDKRTGKALDERTEEAGNVLRHPSKPLLYLSFFRRTSGVYLFDLAQRKMLTTAVAEERLDRMAFLPRDNELLVASPVRSKVLRLDADTLASKGAYPAVFGVRVMAIDEQRRLMLCGSLATGQMSVVELETGKTRSTMYLGPWLRTIVPVVERGVAYVTSNGTLYEVPYAR